MYHNPTMEQAHVERRRRDRRLVRIGLIWGCNVLALLVADLVVRDIAIDPEWRAISAGAVFGIVNWMIKPIIKTLALPLIMLTFGIALFFVNLLVLYIASWISSGFTIRSFGGAIGATIVLWLVNAALHAILDIRGDPSKASRRRFLHR
jgi:putative membrane protein